MAARVEPVVRDAENLDRLRGLVRALDLAVRIPGTNIRFGLDPLLGLVPGAGDIAGGLLSGALIMAAARAGAPGSVLARMLMNVAVDTGLGAVPVLGDVFDIAFKSNAKNLTLLERHLEAPSATRAASRAMVFAVLFGLVLLVVVGVFLAVKVVQWVLGLF